jgi:phosphohistidine phosphatase
MRAAIRPEVVLCSSATRVLQTLEPIVAATGRTDRIQVESGLYGATAEQLLTRLRAVDEQVTSALVVGHNPGLQDLAIDLASDNPQVVAQLREKFPTGALAVVVLDSSWHRLSPRTAHIASVTVPRQLSL